MIVSDEFHFFYVLYFIPFHMTETLGEAEHPAIHLVILALAKAKITTN